MRRAPSSTSRSPDSIRWSRSSHRRVIKLLVTLKLLREDFARNLLSWKHSAFSIDNSVRMLDYSAQESLAEYIARPPKRLQLIRRYGLYASRTKGR